MPLQPSSVSTRRDTNDDVCATVKAKDVEGSNSLRAAIKMQGRNERQIAKGNCMKMYEMNIEMVWKCHASNFRSNWGLAFQVLL